VLDKGRVVQSGTHQELLQRPGGTYRQIYDIQTRIDEELEHEIQNSEIGILTEEV
jgi:ATP-binding cassette subfamily B protein